jgi:hypothetical protein
MDEVINGIEIEFDDKNNDFNFKISKMVDEAARYSDADLAEFKE